jgi:branched-chain amino acid transport system permease protein
MPRRQLVLWVVCAAALVILPSRLFSEVFVLRLGNVLVVAIAAIGLHILVNWAGELSLAQAAFVGMPGLLVAKLSFDHQISPITLVPVGIVMGAIVGGVVGMPALRAKGLYVVIVTIAAQLGIQSFFYTKSWLVGAGGEEQVAVARLGPWTFLTNRQLFPFLAVVFVLVIVLVRVLYHSKVARGLLWIRENPEAAAAAGVPVSAYRTIAYVLAGAFAGLSGALAATWVGRVSPGSFGLQQSLTYLIIVVIGGPGFIGGTIGGAFILTGGNLIIPEGIRLLDYIGPLGLVYTLTSAKGGLNRAGREISARVRHRRGSAIPPAGEAHATDPAPAVPTGP